MHPRVHLGYTVSRRPRAIIMLGLFLTTSHRMLNPHTHTDTLISPLSPHLTPNFTVYLRYICYTATQPEPGPPLTLRHGEGRETRNQPIFRGKKKERGGGGGGGRGRRRGRSARGTQRAKENRVRVQLICVSVFFSWQHDKGSLSVTVSGETTLLLLFVPLLLHQSLPKLSHSFTQNISGI